MPPAVTPGLKANDTALALKWWNAGYHDYATLTVKVALDIATFEHKSSHDPIVVARARLAAAKVIYAKSPGDYPGGITAIIGNTVGSLPFVPSPVDQSGNEIPKPAASGVIEGVVKAPLTVAEFLAKLTDPFLWVRVAEVAGGGILLVIGIRMLAREQGINIPIPKPPMLRGK